MAHYVYKVTNKENQKTYIGKRKSSKPYTDSYMGSGSQIKAAIEKYGLSNFSKEILGVFETDLEASMFESSLVTRDLIDSGMSYNMHEGGYGGFHHINKLPIDLRPNVVAFREKVASGEITPGGTKNWTEDSYQRVVDQGRQNNISGLTAGWNHTDSVRHQMSKRTKGSNNPQYGKKSYTNTTTGDKQKFKPEDVPDGWVLTEAHKQQKMANSKRWYNNGEKNFYITLPNPLINELNLVKGRL